jgi:hypothetical protein
MTADPSSDHPAAMAAALDALAPADEAGFLWFGDRFDPGPGEPLTSAIADRLYGSWYTQGAPVAAVPSPASRWLADGATTGPAMWPAGEARHPGWTVRSVTPDGIEVVRRGLRLHVGPGDVAPAERARPGAVVALVTPRSMERWATGFTVLAGTSVPHPGEIGARIYVNVRPVGATTIIRRLETGLDVAGVPYVLKVVADRTGFGRADTAVAYVRAADLATATDAVIAVTNPSHAGIGDAIPTMTLRLGPGVACAEHPDDGASFGRHRCGLIAESVTACWERGAYATETLLDAVAGAFERAGTSLEEPYRRRSHPFRPSHHSPPAPARRTVRAPQRDPLDAAAEIAHGIRRDAIWHEARCSWMAPHLDGSYRPLGDSLYDGTAGVGLVLAEVAAATGDPRLRGVALGAIRHATGRAGDRGGLHGGAAGVALAAVRCAQLLEAEELVVSAMRILAGIRPDDPETDLLSGVAGTALVLAVLRPVTDADRRRLSIGAEALLERATARGTDLSWATGPDDAPGHLLGMAHGAAGIGLALAAAAVALDRSDLAEAARAAAAYERRHRDPATGRWPDLGADGASGGPPSLPMSWCRGTPGVALARLHVGTLLDDGELLDEARHGLAATAEAVRRSLRAGRLDGCLCHGPVGNADVLLEGARMLPDADPGWHALIADAAAAEPEADGADPGLMLGAAGVALFLLRVHDPDVPGVLAFAPGAPGRAPKTEEIDAAAIR